MNCLLKISSFTDRTSHRQVPESQYLVHVNPDLIQIPEGETPIDLVMEQMTKVQSLSDASGLLRPFHEIHQSGLSHMRSVVLASAVAVAPLHALFQARADHVIKIRMGEIREGWSIRSAWLSLDGEPEIEISTRSLACAEDRDVRNEMEPASLFERLNHRNHDGRLRPDQMSSGALLAGMFQAHFSDTPKAPRNRLTADHAILAGVLAMRAGVSFALHEGDVLTDDDRAVSAMGEQYNIFLSEGYVFSDRGWNPEHHLPGVRLAEACENSDRGLQEVGARLYENMKEMDPITTHLATRHLLEGRKPVGSYILPRHPHVEISRHRQLQIEAMAARLADCLGDCAAR